MQSNSWSTGLLVLALLGVVVIALLSVSERSVEIFVICILVASASTALGFLLGFLFGIPRSLQDVGFDVAPRVNELKAGGDNKEQFFQARYRANTNLEQISDWLTKILVGVGLTQLPSIAIYIEQFGLYVVGEKATHLLLAQIISLIGIFYLIISFIFFYLWTRLFLGGQLAQADLQMFADRLDSITKKTTDAADHAIEASQRLVREIEDQSKIDARALNLVNFYLSQEHVGHIDISELKENVRSASATVRVQIFHRARQVRSENWMDEKKRYWVERTIPVFEALIDADPTERYHQNYANLAFALKDQRDTSIEDYQKAVELLEKAIKIRGDYKVHGNEVYEFVRAICLICSDYEYLSNKATEALKRDAIVSDLSVAARVFPDFNSEEIILKWLSLNEIAEIEATR